MNKSAVLFLIAFSVSAGTARESAAQGATWADRGYINFSFGVESGTTDMSVTRTAPIYEETGTFTSSSSFTSGAIYDVGVGFRLFRNLTVGVGYHQEKNDTEGRITGSIPSPIFFNRPRTIDQAVPELERLEKAVHLQIGWVVPIGDRLDILVSGGPSFFRMEQDVVGEVTFGEQGGSFATVVAAPTITTRKQSQTGYNVGVDGTYIVWQNDSVRVGAGGFVRFAQAEMDIEMLSGSTPQPTTVGGVQFGFGARLRF